MRILTADGESVTIELTLDELDIVNNAINEVCHGPDAIEDWEFQTRMGVERSEARRLLDEIGKLLR